MPWTMHNGYLRLAYEARTLHASSIGALPKAESQERGM